jgi:hypothetical protein
MNLFGFVLALQAMVAESSSSQRSKARSQKGESSCPALTDKKLLFATPVVLDAARVRENCFSLSFIPGPTLSGESGYARAFSRFF